MTGRRKAGDKGAVSLVHSLEDSLAHRRTDSRWRVTAAAAAY